MIGVNTVYLRGSRCETVYLTPDELSRNVYIATAAQLSPPEYYSTRTLNGTCI